MVYNILNCAGWSSEAAGYIGSSGCIKARLGILALFFIIAFVRKWGGEEMGVSFSLLFGLAGGLGAYLVVITLSGSLGFAFVIGLVGALALGYGLGMFAGDEGY